MPHLVWVPAATRDAIRAEMQRVIGAADLAIELPAEIEVVA